MDDLVIPLNIALAVGLVALVIYQGLTRSVELLTIRNLYIAGFIVYQIFSPLRVLFEPRISMFSLEDPERAGAALLGHAIVFLPCFFFAYHKSIVGKWFARRLESRPTVTPDMVLILLALTLALVGVGVRLLPSIPVVRTVAYHLAIGLSVVASGLVGWVWSKRRANLAVILVGAVVFGICIGVALYGSFGRRSLLAVAMGLSWGAYYGFGKRLKPLSLIFWSTPLILIAVVLVSAFTTIRGRVENDSLNPVQVIRAMADFGAVQRGAKDVAGGQACGSAAMWCAENYPRPHEPRHLFSLKQMGYQFVPKIWWPEKPKPLANQMASLGNIRGVNHKKITIPPGVIGYTFAEGGLYAAVVYGLFFGGFIRFFDEVVRLNGEDPFLVAVCGCTTGHFLGLARGDLANFTVNILVTFIATLLCIGVIRFFFGKQIQRQVVYWRLEPTTPSAQPYA